MASYPKGMTINCSVITNDKGNQEVGFRYTDTSGIDIDRHYEGNDLMKIINTLYGDVVSDMTKQNKEILAAKQEKEKSQAASKKSAPVKNDFEVTLKGYEAALQKAQAELKALQTENDSLKIDNKILNERVKNVIKQQEEPKDNFELPVSEFLKKMMDIEW